MPDDGLVGSVKRFDGKNFQAWKYKITAVLKAKEIFDVVSGARVLPGNQEGANAGRTKQWLKDDARATAVITSTMDDEQVNSVLVCATARTMHGQKSVSNVDVLEQRYHSYKMGPTDSVI